MRSVPVQELKQNLADWLNRAESGERIVITVGTGRSRSSVRSAPV
jgi:prevent-host-death family protein